MDCEGCGGNTKVVDTRGRKHSKSELQVRLKLPFIFDSSAPYRWRKRKCSQCLNISYSVEIDIDRLKNLVQNKGGLK